MLQKNARSAVSISFVALAAFGACKPRNDDASALREASPDNAGTPTMLFDMLETDLARVEGSVQLAGDPGALGDVSGFALNDTIDERQHMLDLAKELQEYAADRVHPDRAKLEGMVEELQALAELLSGLSASDKERARAAVARIQTILASPPGATPPPAQRPSVPPPAIGDVPDSLFCKRLSGGTFLPAYSQSGQVFGTPGQNGGGFTKRSNCELVVERSRNGLVCSISSTGDVSPFRLSDGGMIGPQKGFAQTANCVAAVSASDGTICLVDNRPGVQQYAKYHVPSGNVIDYWFSDHDRCRRGDKSPDPRQACYADCQRTYDICEARANRLPGFDKTSASIKCLHDKIVVCEKRCG